MIIQPMTTSDPIQALQKISGVTELNHLGVIRAAGSDAATFLQGQLTQDLVSMGLDTARLAAFCNAKGRMQASFVVFKRKSDDGADEFLMVCSQDILAQTLKRLSMFVMRAKVKLTDASADFVLYGMVGEAVNAIYSVAARAHIHWSKHDFEGVNMVFLYPGAGLERVMWCAPFGSPLPAGQVLPESVWNWLEVQSGIAMITQPIFEAFVPQMLNYESVGGVNFKKGCYPGQEVVARSQFRGTLKRRAYVMNSQDEPQVGQEVFHSSDAEQPCGLVAACAANPSGGFDAIVSMQTSAALGGRLSLGSSQGAALTLLPLPYSLLEDI
jgi:tRNA-modifying protein YgfZ